MVSCNRKVRRETNASPYPDLPLFVHILAESDIFCFPISLSFQRCAKVRTKLVAPHEIAQASA